MKENSLQFSSSPLLTPTLSHFPHHRALASLSRSVHVLLFSTTAFYNLPDNSGLVPARAGHSRHGPDAPRNLLGHLRTALSPTFLNLAQQPTQLSRRTNLPCRTNLSTRPQTSDAIPASRCNLS